MRDTFARRRCRKDRWVQRSPASICNFVSSSSNRGRGSAGRAVSAVGVGNATLLVLAEKPATTTDSDRMDRGALDQLLLHTGTLGSIYHKNPEVCSTALYFCCHILIVSTDLHPKRGG